MATTDSKLRLLTAVPVCDGHDSAINTINLELVHRGHEVVYLGYHRPARDVVRAAIQEGVQAVGLSSYNGGHVEFFAAVAEGLKGTGIGVIGGGGGTITKDDEAEMLARGVDRIFFAGTPLDEMMDWLADKYGGNELQSNGNGDAEISRRLDQVDPAGEPRDVSVVGFTGPGGAGKTTLIDELVLRFLKHREGRVAILSHDPSIVGNGALLGDRATMIHSQHDRVFMRSLATRGQAGGLGPQTADMLRVLKSTDGIELILIETVGTGQEALPFKDEVDHKVFVMSPEYGSRLQLQKIAMLDAADTIVVNKNDRPAATTARNEVDARLRMNRTGHADVFTTCAKRHRDAGVDALFDHLMDPKNAKSQREQRAAKV